MDVPEPTVPLSSRPGVAAGRRWQAPSVEELQQRLPAYDVVEMLGQGGMGAVYKGRQKTLRRTVAIKILPPDAVDDESRHVERFKNEACTLAQMSHPGIVNVFDFGETNDGLLYFVMEFVDGTDVGQMIQAGGKLPPDQALTICSHVCEALEYAHKNGVIHRDIKPANVLINRQGQVKVADFGLAKMLNDAELTHALTRSNTAMGTPDYVSPEALAPGVMVDHRADIYAVGVMLYQMLTGEVPRGMFKLPSQKVPEVDIRVDEIICKAMEQDREERYQTAQDVRRALEEIQTTPLTKADPGGSPGMPMPVSELPKKNANHSVYVAVAAAAALVIVGAILVGRNGRDDPQSAPAPKDIAPAAAASVGAIAADKPGDGAVWKDWLASPPPWGGDWDLRDGVRVALGQQSARGLGSMRDGAIRISAHPPVSGPGAAYLLQIDLRNGPVKGAAEVTGCYQFQTHLPSRKCTLLYQEQHPNEEKKRPVEYLWQDKPLPPNLAGRTDLEWELRAVGDELSAWVNGELIASVRDARVPAGGRLLKARAGIGISLLKSRDYLRASQGGDTLLVDWLQAVKWEAPWVLKDGVLSPSSRMAMRDLGDVNDGVIRISSRVTEGASVVALKSPVMEPIMRITPVRPGWLGFYQFQAYMPGRTCSLLYMERENTKTGEERPPEYLWKEKPLPQELVGKQEIDWEFRVVGDELSAWANGRLVASAHDSRLSSGLSRLMAHPGVEISRLETTGITPTLSGASPPVISDWQDVTEAVREKARSIPALIVDADAVRHSGSGNPVGIPLTRGGVRDYAVRIRYTESVQIDLRANPGRFIYVYARGKAKETLFHRHESGGAAPAVLRPNQPHPADYDATIPHELLVTIQGSTIRAWLDSHFLGDTEETTLKDGPAELMFTKSTVVHQVDIAELAAGEPKLGGQPARVDGVVTDANPVTSSGRTVDLLALVDVTRGAIRGTWTRSARGISVAPQSGVTVLEAPYQPPEEYDYEIEFTPDNDGMNVNQYLSAGGRSFAWKLNSHNIVPPLYGFELLDGRFAKDLREAAMQMDAVIEKGRRYRSTIEVRRGSLRALLDGKELVRWSGDFKRFSMEDNSRLRDEFHLGVGSWKRAVTFHKIQVTEVTGTGRVDAGPIREAKWRDWFEPWFSKWTFNGTGWIKEAEGVTTDQQFRGEIVLPATTRDGAVRLAYTMRNSEGASVTFRHAGAGQDRRFYVAYDAGKTLYISLATGAEQTRLVSEAIPAEIRGNVERTLEVRFVGNRLTATLNGSFNVTATDDTLIQGECAMVLHKGALLKKVETLALDRPKPAPVNEDFMDMIAAVNAPRQVELVAEKIRLLNGVQPELLPTIVAGKVTGLVIRTANPTITDISPVAALKHLTALRTDNNEVRDISCLAGLPLEDLALLGGAFTDLSALKSMPLKTLSLRGSHVEDFSVLAGKPLERLQLNLCRAMSDISFVKGLPLTYLKIDYTGVRDLSPLAGLPLTELECNPDIELDAALLRSIPMLKIFNKQPVAELLPQAAPSPTAGDPGGWQPLFTNPENLGEHIHVLDPKCVEFRNGVLFLKDKTIVTKMNSVAGAVRATMKYVEGNTGSVTIRASEDVAWGKESFAAGAYISGGGKTVVLYMRHPKQKGSEPDKHTFPLAVPVQAGNPFSMELRIEKNQISVSVDGRQAGAVDDPTPSIRRRFGVIPPLSEFGEFREIAWLPLPASP